MDEIEKLVKMIMISRKDFAAIVLASDHLLQNEGQARQEDHCGFLPC